MVDSGGMTRGVARAQGLLPGCNVAIMVQLQPQLFLSQTTAKLQSQVGTAYDIISRELPCEYVDAMVQVSSRSTELSALGQYDCCPFSQLVAGITRQKCCIRR